MLETTVTVLIFVVWIAFSIHVGRLIVKSLPTKSNLVRQIVAIQRQVVLVQKSSQGHSSEGLITAACLIAAKLQTRYNSVVIFDADGTYRVVKVKFPKEKY